MISRADRHYEATSVNVTESEHRLIPIGDPCLVESTTFDADERPFV